VSDTHRDKDEPVLITDAEPSLDDELARRRRTYVRIMVVHLVGFALSYPLYLWQWWAGVLAVVLTGALPWVAVLLANDKPRARREKPPRMPPRAIR
jgi:fatty acid desaturase